MTIDDELRALLKRHIDDPDLFGSFHVFSRRMHLSKVIGHYEIYRQVAHLPGDVVELGVYRGESLFNFARFVEMLNPGDRGKRILGFDHWRGLVERTEEDGASARVGNVDGGWDPSGFRDTLLELVDLYHRDSFVPHKPRIHIVEGDIRETAPAYVEGEPGLRVALLHLDCDLYEPTLAGLKAFYPKLVTGGAVVLDEYGLADWPGESKAVDEYFDGHPPEMRKLGYLTAPGAYFFKP